MFCWFYLGTAPEKIQVYNPKTKKHEERLKPRDPVRTGTANADKIAPAKVARSAEADMQRLREKAAARREQRTGSRSAKRVAPKVERDAGAPEG